MPLKNMAVDAHEPKLYGIHAYAKMLSSFGINFHFSTGLNLCYYYTVYHGSCFCIIQATAIIQGQSG